MTNGRLTGQGLVFGNTFGPGRVGPNPMAQAPYMNGPGLGNPQDPNNPANQGGLSGTAIACICAGGGVFLLILCCVVYLCISKSNSPRRPPPRPSRCSSVMPVRPRPSRHSGYSSRSGRSGRSGPQAGLGGRSTPKDLCRCDPGRPATADTLPGVAALDGPVAQTGPGGRRDRGCRTGN